MTQCVKVTFFLDSGSRVEIACYHPCPCEQMMLTRRRTTFLRAIMGAASEMLLNLWVVRIGSWRLMGIPNPWGGGFHAISFREETDRVFNR